MTSAGPWARWSLIALLAVLLVAVLLLPLPSFHTVVWAAIENAAHAPIFGAVALLADSVLRRVPQFARVVPRYLAAGGISFAFGFSIEVLQFFGPRDASFGDLVTNALGVIGALAAHGAAVSAPTRSIRVGLLVIAAVCIVAVLAPVATAFAATVQRDREFPILVNYDSRLDLELMRVRRARIVRTPWPDAWSHGHDGPALRVDFEHVAGTSGLIFEEPVRDWSKFRQLVLDIANPTRDTFAIVLYVDDEAHDRRPTDRYIGVFSVPPHTREQIRVPLDAIRRGPPDRMLDLTQITAIMLFRADGNGASHCYLGPIRLE